MRTLALSAALILFAGFGNAALAGTVKLEKSSDKVAVTIDGEAFTTFNTSTELPKPFFFPVLGPGGTSLARPLENPADHKHHKGIWLSIDEVNELKHWAEKHKIANVSADVVVAEGDPAVLRVVNHWLDDAGQPVLIEKTDVRIYTNRVVAYDITFTAGDKQVTFGDTKEGLFGFRMVDSMREKEGGRVVNAEGKQGTAECWGKPSAWVDYVGEVEGKTFGVAIFDNPLNFRASRYHVRDYGLFSISPFGEHSYTNGASPEETVILQPGNSLRLRYALYIHAGDTASADVAGAYKAYLKAGSAE